MNNEYYEKLLRFKESLINIATCIFRTYGDELELRLQDYNLLDNKNNCIESSTSIGYVIEEFIVSKLEAYTHCSGYSGYVFNRLLGPTTSECYDCFSQQSEGDTKFMVNVKVEKSGRANTAVAAIKQIYENYCVDDPDTEKALVVFKVKYSIKGMCEKERSKNDKPRHIHIEGLEAYCLEEFDLSNGYRQDNRNWSTDSNRNSGRLQLSNAFRNLHRLAQKDISYANTKQMIFKIYNNNL